MYFLVLYLLLFIFLFLFYLFTRNYKKEFTSGLDAKQHPFRFLYGTSLFCIDFIGHLHKKFFPNHIKKNTKLRTNLDKLYLGKNIEQEELLFHSKRTASAFAFFTLFILLGLFYTIYSVNIRDKPVSSLARTNDDSDYSLEVTIEDKETQIVDISVPSRQYDFQETFELFDNYRDELISELLSGNKSIEEIKSPLNFISKIGEEGLTINWEIENELLIDYSGEIHPEYIDSEGAATYVIANLSLGDYNASLTIPLILVP